MTINDFLKAFINTGAINGGSTSVFLRQLHELTCAQLWQLDIAKKAISANRFLFNVRALKEIPKHGKTIEDAKWDYCQYLKELTQHAGLDPEQLGALLKSDFDPVPELREQARPYLNKKALKELSELAHDDPEGAKAAENAMLDSLVIGTIFPFRHENDKGVAWIDRTALKSYIRDRLNPCVINNSIAYYNGKGYVIGTKAFYRLLNVLADLSSCPALDDKAKKSILDDLYSDSSRQFDAANQISVGNGILTINPETFEVELKAHSNRAVIPNYTSVNYIPNVEALYPDAVNAVNNAFRGWADIEHHLDEDRGNLETLLYEIIGYGLFNSMKFKQGFLLYGRKNSGKSSYIALIKSFFGQDACADLTLSDAAEKFKTAELQNKAVWIGDDAMDGVLKGTGVATLKKLISGEGLTAERKFCNPERFENRAKFIGACNSLPIINDKALDDRLTFVPFDNHFTSTGTGNDANANYGKDLASVPHALEVILFRAVRELCQMLKREQNGGAPFIQCDACERLKREHMRVTNAVYAWLEFTPGTRENQAYSICCDRKLQGDKTPYTKGAHSIYRTFLTWLTTHKDELPNFTPKFPDFTSSVESYFEGLVRTNTSRSYFYDPEKNKGGDPRTKDGGAVRDSYFEYVGKPNAALKAQSVSGENVSGDKSIEPPPFEYGKALTWDSVINDDKKGGT